jgi:pyruvate formate lyase activating enzyme
MPTRTPTAAKPPGPSASRPGPPVRGRIFDLKRFSTHDGPGIRSTVFLTGCPLRCAWCHNPEAFALEEPGSAPTSQVREVSVDQLVRELERDIPYFDRSGGGVTISGGEPLSQPDFTRALLAACRRRELHAALDTSGCADPTVFAKAAALARLVLYDIKLLDDDMHVEWTGTPNTIILENLRGLESIDTEVWIRLPLVPGVNDHPDHISAILDLLRRTRFRQVSLLPFHRIGEGKYKRLGLPDRMAGIKAPSDADIETIRSRFANAGFNVSIGK